MVAAKQNPRKLISLNGFLGFRAQLADNEILILISTDDHGVAHKDPVTTRRAFDRINQMDGERIIGWYAYPTANWFED